MFIPQTATVHREIISPLLFVSTVWEVMNLYQRGITERCYSYFFLTIVIDDERIRDYHGRQACCNEGENLPET